MLRGVLCKQIKMEVPFDSFKNVICKLLSILFRPRCVKHWYGESGTKWSPQTFLLNFWNDRLWICIGISLYLFQWIKCQHWFRQWLGTWQVTSHYLNQCWPRSERLHGITRPKWMKCLGICVTSFKLKWDLLCVLLRSKCPCFARALYVLYIHFNIFIKK